MLAKEIIDNLLIEMPQFKLTSGNPDEDARQGDHPELFATAYIEDNYPFKLTATATVTLPDGRQKSFRETGSMTQDDITFLDAANPHSITISTAGDRTLEKFRTRRTQLSNKYRDTLEGMVDNVREKVKAWWMANVIPLKHMPRVKTVETGLHLAKVVPLLAELGLKYVWVKSTDRPQAASETVAAFTAQKDRPDEELVKLVHSNDTEAAVYTYITQEEWAQLERKIIELNRAKVGRRL